MRWRFASIDELVDRFGLGSVFFACWAYPSFMLRGEWVGRGITRELRCGMGEDWMRLTVHEVGTEWSGTLTKRLARAGYEVNRLEDEVVFRRDWHDSRERDRELVFARSLGVLGTPARWPTRRRNRRSRGEMPIREVKQVIAAARRSQIHWHQMALVMSRRVVSRDNQLRVTVNVHLDIAPHLHGECVDLYIVTQSDDLQRLDRVRRKMRSAGFDGGRPARPWFGHKRVRSIIAALRERDAILEWI